MLNMVNKIIVGQDFFIISFIMADSKLGVSGVIPCLVFMVLYCFHNGGLIFFAIFIRKIKGSTNKIFNILYKDNQLDYNNESDDSFDNLSNQKSFRKNLKRLVTYQLKDVKYPSTIFKTNSQNFVLWQLIIVILSIYQVISIPIAIAFDPDIFNAPTFRTIDSLSDLAFVFDIVLNFRTSYIDPISGEEILNPLIIASKYLSSIQFYIDVLSSVPLNQFFPSVPLLNFLGLLKILRIRRVNNFIMDLNIPQRQKTFLKVIFLVFIMLMYLHLASCIWYTVIQQDERWIPSMEFVFPQTPMMYDYYYSIWQRTYIYTLYTSYFLFWMTEISPKLELQFFTAICILMLSSIMNGLIVGNMAHNINDINQSTKKLQQHLDTMNGAMNQLQLPPHIMREVNEFFIQTHSYHQVQLSLKDFLQKRISKTYKI